MIFYELIQIITLYSEFGRSLRSGGYVAHLQLVPKPRALTLPFFEAALSGRKP